MTVSPAAERYQHSSFNRALPISPPLRFDNDFFGDVDPGHWAAVADRIQPLMHRVVLGQIFKNAPFW
jgi:hypothetical protein